MQKHKIGSSNLMGSDVIMGTYQANKLTDQALENHLKVAIECGINHFDLADTYGKNTNMGLVDARIGKVLNFAKNPALRQQLIIQSKFGIRRTSHVFDGSPMLYTDTSQEHILDSVEGTLARLGTDYLDILVIHKPDPFMDPIEIAKTFQCLQKSGKVRYFGVSNMLPSQMEVLNRALDIPLIMNQVHYSIADQNLMDFVNHMPSYAGYGKMMDAGAGTMDYCFMNNMQLQAWAPFSYMKGNMQQELNTFTHYRRNTNPCEPEELQRFTYLDGYKRFHHLMETLTIIAKRYETNASAIALAWFLSTPLPIIPIAGTTNETHLRQLVEGSEIKISRMEWFDIAEAVGKYKASQER